MPAPAEGQTHAFVAGHDGSGEEEGNVEGELAKERSAKRKAAVESENIDPSLEHASSTEQGGKRVRILEIDFTGYQAPTIPRTLPPLPLDPDFDLRPAKRHRSASGSTLSQARAQQPQSRGLLPEQHQVESQTAPQHQLEPQHGHHPEPQHEFQPQQQQQLESQHQYQREHQEHVHVVQDHNNTIFDPSTYVHPSSLSSAQRDQRRQVLQEQLQMLQGWVEELGNEDEREQERERQRQRQQEEHDRDRLREEHRRAGLWGGDNRKFGVY